MNLPARFLRCCAKTRFKVLGHATIKDIPTEKLNEIRELLISDGWQQYYEYSGFDAWIDYGCVKLKRDRTKLMIEWDNWTEGSIEGRRETIRALGKLLGMPVSDEWRWSVWDEDRTST